MVSSAAVSLLERQEFNAALDKRKKVLEAAGLIETNQPVTAEEVESFFVDFETVALDMTTRKEDPEFELEGYDQLKAQGDPERSYEAPANNASIRRIPNKVQIYKLKDESDALSMVIVPIEGLGLWGTLYGYLALDPGSNEVRGITYYRHKETPGLRR